MRIIIITGSSLRHRAFAQRLKVSKKKIPYRITNRRKGDLEGLCADPEYANNFLNWKAQYDLEKMCLDSWNRKGIS